MQYVVIGLDGTDDEASSRRAAARPAHLVLGDELLKSGNLWFAAALLDNDGVMNGSVYHLNFESYSKFQSWYETEPYIVGDVWRTVNIHNANTRDPWQFSHDKEWFEKYSVE